MHPSVQSSYGRGGVGWSRWVMGGMHTCEELSSKVTPRNSVPLEFGRGADS